MKTPVIYDTIMSGDREERVVNQEATLAAREKQKAIKSSAMKTTKSVFVPFGEILTKRTA